VFLIGNVDGSFFLGPLFCHYLHLTFRARLIHPDIIVDGIDLHEEVSFVHELIVRYVEGLDGSADLGGDHMDPTVDIGVIAGPHADTTQNTPLSS